MKTLDYINVRDAQVHGLVNPTFIMYGNCSLKDYSFEVTVDGKKREARFLPDLASDNYELTLSLSKDDSKVKVYLIHDDQKELVCVRKNTLMKRIKSKIRTLLQKTVRKTKETKRTDLCGTALHLYDAFFSFCACIGGRNEKRSGQS